MPLTQSGLKSLVEPHIEANIGNTELLDLLQRFLSQNEEMESIAMQYGVPFDEGATEYEFSPLEVETTVADEGENTALTDLQEKYDTLMSEYKNRFMGGTPKNETETETETVDDEGTDNIDELFKPIKKGE